MATSTFDKNITIDQEAAERLIKVLEQPAQPRPLESDFWKENERKVKKWKSLHSEKQSNSTH